MHASNQTIMSERTKGDAENLVHLCAYTGNFESLPFVGKTPTEHSLPSMRLQSSSANISRRRVQPLHMSDDSPERCGIASLQQTPKKSQIDHRAPEKQQYIAYPQLPNTSRRCDKSSYHVIHPRKSSPTPSEAFSTTKAFSPTRVENALTLPFKNSSSWSRDWKYFDDRSCTGPSKIGSTTSNSSSIVTNKRFNESNQDNSLKISEPLTQNPDMATLNRNVLIHEGVRPHKVNAISLPTAKTIAIPEYHKNSDSVSLSSGHICSEYQPRLQLFAGSEKDFRLSYAFNLEQPPYHASQEASPTFSARDHEEECLPDFLLNSNVCITRRSQNCDRPYAVYSTGSPLARTGANLRRSYV
jgi:hypothetical protein